MTRILLSCFRPAMYILHLHVTLKMLFDIEISVCRNVAPQTWFSNECDLCIWHGQTSSIHLTCCFPFVRLFVQTFGCFALILVLFHLNVKFKCNRPVAALFIYQFQGTQYFVDSIPKIYSPFQCQLPVMCIQSMYTLSCLYKRCIRRSLNNLRLCNSLIIV